MRGFAACGYWKLSLPSIVRLDWKYSPFMENDAQKKFTKGTRNIIKTKEDKFQPKCVHSLTFFLKMWEEL